MLSKFLQFYLIPLFCQLETSLDKEFYKIRLSEASRKLKILNCCFVFVWLIFTNYERAIINLQNKFYFESKKIDSFNFIMFDDTSAASLFVSSQILTFEWSLLSEFWMLNGWLVYSWANLRKRWNETKKMISGCYFDINIFGRRKSAFNLSTEKIKLLIEQLGW